MKIKKSEFCALSSQLKFHQWLLTANESLYKELFEHLRKSAGCASNAAKMSDILSRLISDVDTRNSLQTFLIKNFPSVVEGIDNESHKHKDSHKIFKHYDPRSNTIPRRLIITKYDASTNGQTLDEAVYSFCGMQCVCRKLMIDDRCYIEYLPKSMASIIKDIPSDNWQIPDNNS